AQAPRSPDRLAIGPWGPRPPLAEHAGAGTPVRRVARRAWLWQPSSFALPSTPVVSARCGRDHRVAGRPDRDARVPGDALQPLRRPGADGADLGEPDRRRIAGR